MESVVFSVSLPNLDGVAKSGRGMRSDIFNPLCISPNLGGEEYKCPFVFGLVFAFVFAFVFALIRTRARCEDARST